MTAARRWFALPLLASLPLTGVSGAAQADGEPYPGFGVDGVAAINICGGRSTDIVTVIDDPLGHLMALVRCGSFPAIPAPGPTPTPDPTNHVIRVGFDGTLDLTYGGGDGIADLPEGWPSTLSMTYFGDVLVGGRFPRVAPSGVYRLSVDGLSVAPVAPSGLLPSEVTRSLELPDLRVVVGRSVSNNLNGGTQVVLDAITAHGIDPSFDGSIGSALSSTPVAVVGLAARPNGSLVALLAIFGPSTSWALVGFDANGTLDTAFNGSGILRLPDGFQYRLHSHPATPVLTSLSLSATVPVLAQAVQADGQLLTVPWPSAATITATYDGTGRLLATGVPGTLLAYFRDGSLDPGFGDNGVVDLPRYPNGILALDTGDIVLWGIGLGGGYIQLIASPWGSAPQPYLLPTTKFVPVSPHRIVDTRLGLGAAQRPLADNGELVIQVAGAAGIPSTGVEAVVLNITVTQTTAPGFVTLYPTGGGRPIVSNLNVGGRGETAANLVTVAADSAGRVTAYALRSTHLVVDVAGYYTEALASADGRLEPIVPTRILDTRSGLGAPAGIVPRNTSIDLDIDASLAAPSSGVSAVVLNLTGTQAISDGHVTVWPTGQPRPEASNLNLLGGGTRANLVIVPVGSDGRVSIYTYGGAHLIADLAGWFTDATVPIETTGLFVPITPTRMLDTRQVWPSPLNSGQTVYRRYGGTMVIPPYAASALALNVTLTGSRAAGHLTVYPTAYADDGSTIVPEASNVNVTGVNQTVPNAAIAALADDDLTAYTFGGGHIIIDVAGWYTAY